MFCSGYCQQLYGSIHLQTNSLKPLLHCGIESSSFLWGVLHLLHHLERKLQIRSIHEEVWNFYSDLGVETATHLWKNCVDCSRDQTTILVVLSASCHGESFTSSSLTIAHNGTVYAVNYSGNGLLAAIFKNVLLACVMHQLIELELPCFSLIVYMPSMLVFGDLYRNSLRV
jgi:hypothetical protein